MEGGGATALCRRERVVDLREGRGRVDWYWWLCMRLRSRIPVFGSGALFFYQMMAACLDALHYAVCVAAPQHLVPGRVGEFWVDYQNPTPYKP